MSKPTIVVVGLLPGQAAQVEKQCKNARLRFVRSLGNKPSLPSGDHIVLLIKFVRHLWTTQALKKYPRSQVYYHLGGIAGVADLVNGITGGTAVARRHA